MLLICKEFCFLKLLYLKNIERNVQISCERWLVFCGSVEHSNSDFVGLVIQFKNTISWNNILTEKWNSVKP